MLPTDSEINRIISAASIERTWLFEITPASPINGISEFFWAMGDTTYNGAAYSGQIIEKSFTGITMALNSSYNIITPNETSFNAFYDITTAASFKDAKVVVRLLLSDYISTRQVCAFRMIARECFSDDAGSLLFICEDFVARSLDKLYPNRPRIEDIFPDTGDNIDTALCVPRIFGTAYIPLRPCYIPGKGRKYLLGTADETYTVEACHSPSEYGSSEWSTGITFTQSTETGADGKSYRFVEPIVVDLNGDGVPDACPVFPSGTKLLNMPVKFIASDTAALTNPADDMKQFFKDLGFLDADLGDSFATAAATFAVWGLTWPGGGYVSPDKAYKVLGNMQSMSNSQIVVLEKIEIFPLTADPAFVFDETVIKDRDGSDGKPTFETTYKRQAQVRKRLYDSGYIAYPKSGQPQDTYYKFVVPVKTTTDNPSGNTLEMPLIDDDAIARKVGILYHQRQNLPNASVSLDAYSAALLIMPGDVGTCQGDKYGSNSSFLITEKTFNLEGDCTFRGNVLENDLDDYTALNPASLTIAAATDSGTYSPVISGPDSTGESLNQIQGRLRLGTSILLDPDLFGGQGAIQLGTNLTHNLSPFNIDDKLYIDETDGLLYAPGLVLSGGTGVAWDDITGIPAQLHQVFFESTAPATGMTAGDLWIDTDDNKLYRYGGSTWTEIQDDAIATALSDAEGALSTANVKITTFFQNNAPTAITIGDLWFDTDDNNKPYRWSGSAWVAAPYDVADWSKVTNPPAVLGTPGVTPSCFVNASQLGFWSGSEYVIGIDAALEMFFIHNSTFGNLGIQMEYNNGHPQIYIGDGANQYFKMRYDAGLAQTFLSIHTTNFVLDETGNLVGTGAGDITMQPGADLIMTGHDTNPGLIVFRGSSYDTNIGTSADGSIMMFFPSVDGEGSLLLGSSGGLFSGNKIFNAVIMRAKNEAGCYAFGGGYGQAYHSTQGPVASGDNAQSYFASLKYLTGTSGSYNLAGIWAITDNVGGGALTDKYLLAYGNMFIPSSGDTMDVGTSGIYFKDAWFYDYHTHADLLCLDDYPDLDAIISTKPLLDKDGNPVLDKTTNLPMIDDSSLPAWALSVHGADIPASKVTLSNGDIFEMPAVKAGDPAITNDGTPYLSNRLMFSWLMGAIKQLHGKMTDSIATVSQTNADAIASIQQSIQGIPVTPTPIKS